MQKGASAVSGPSHSTLRTHMEPEQEGSAVAWPEWRPTSYWGLFEIPVPKLYKESRPRRLVSIQAFTLPLQTAVPFVVGY